MSALARHAAWVLLAAFALSLVYELYRATAKAGTSRHDSMRLFLQAVGVYVVPAVAIVGLFAGAGWASWAGLVIATAWIGVSIFYYNPVVMPERQPGIIDWVEDLAFTGLLFVAATLLLYEVLGWSLAVA